MRYMQDRREGGKLPRVPRRLGAPPSLKNINYTIMRNFEKNSHFFPEGLRENVSPGFAVVLDVPGYT